MMSSSVFRFHLYRRWVSAGEGREHHGYLWGQSGKLSLRIPYVCLDKANNCARIYCAVFNLQELANPTVTAPGKGYIGKYSKRVDLRHAITSSCV